MAHEQCIGVRRALMSTFPDSWLRKTAREVGFVQRERKIKATTFFWTLVLGFSAGAERSIAAFRRAYEKAAGVTVVPASFYDRFNAGLVEFLKTAVEKALDDFAAASSDVHERLMRFKDVMLIDSTIITLHDALQHVFRVLPVGLKNLRRATGI